MAKSDIGPKIGIEGEAQFKKQLKDINTGLKTLGSEMKVVTSEFIGNENSVEALSAENDVLGRTISSLNEKLNVQKSQLQASAQAYGIADERTQKLQQAVNRTTAELNTMTAKIAKNTEAIKHDSNAANSLFGVLKGSLTDGLQKLGGQFGLSASQARTLTDALNQSTNKMAGMASGTLSVLGPLALFVTAASKAVSELTKLAEAGGKHVDEIITMSTNYGIAARDLQRFDYMAELTDVSLQTITSSIAKLTRSMDNARNGSESASTAFAKLGVKITDENGNLRDSSVVFREVIDALGRVQNATERDALAMEIFGKSAMELNGIIIIGSEGLRKLAAEADASGYVMSDKMVSALQDADDSTQRLNKSIDGLQNTLGAVVAPAVANVKNELADFTAAVTKTIQEAFNLNDAGNLAAEGINSTSDAAAAGIDPLRQYTEEMERLKYAEMSLNEVWAEMEKLDLGHVATRQEGAWTFSEFVPTGQLASWVQQPTQPIVVQSNISLDNQTVGRALTPVIDSRKAQRGNVF